MSLGMMSNRWSHQVAVKYLPYICHEERCLQVWMNHAEPFRNVQRWLQNSHLELAGTPAELAVLWIQDPLVVLRNLLSFDCAGPGNSWIDFNRWTCLSSASVTVQNACKHGILSLKFICWCPNLFWILTCTCALADKFGHCHHRIYQVCRLNCSSSW